MKSESDTPTGYAVLRDPALNKSTAFSEEERDRYRLRGLLPARVCGQATQIHRVLGNLRRKAHDIERYIFLLALQGRNERLFYRTLIEHIEELMPLVYTPTVGQACKEFAHIFRQPRGLYITPNDRGRIGSLLKNWPETDVRVIVITDGERILGLGDLGANGMGIPIGKLALYTTLAGIHPSQCMPVQFDVGTDNAPLRDDPLYLGVPAPRLRGEPYYELMEEFVMSVQEAYPHALIQFEDFLTPRAFALLRRYRHRVLCFNDDIQGTAAVVLAGAYSAAHIAERPLEKSRVMFLGAGSAATGIADLMVHALVERGLTPDDARRRLWFVDVSGLVVQSRRDLQPHNLPYAHPHQPMEFVDALRAIRPHMLIGATGHPGTFTQEVVRVMAELNDRPVIFALSNPTSRAECTAAQAYEWSGGRVVFASGSPFPPIDLGGGRRWRPSQGNNAYVFPGIGLGAVGCRAKRVTDNMFLAAARALADAVSADDLAAGALYPPLKDVRSVSLAIAAKVAETAYDDGVAQAPRPASLVDHLAAQMYSPIY